MNSRFNIAIGGSLYVHSEVKTHIHWKNYFLDIVTITSWSLLMFVVLKFFKSLCLQEMWRQCGDLFVVMMAYICVLRFLFCSIQ